MNKFREEERKKRKRTEFYRSAVPLRNFQMKSGGLGRRRNFTARAAAYSKKWGAFK